MMPEAGPISAEQEVKNLVLENEIFKDIIQQVCFDFDNSLTELQRGEELHEKGNWKTQSTEELKMLKMLLTRNPVTRREIGILLKRISGADDVVASEARQELKKIAWDTLERGRKSNMFNRAGVSNDDVDKFTGKTA